jgi:ATP-dependent protease ClpP protease subunit
MIQDRIVTFITTHAKIQADVLEQMMIREGVLTKDLGTILIGREAVDAGLADAVGGIGDALDKIHELSLENNF